MAVTPRIPSSSTWPDLPCPPQSLTAPLPSQSPATSPALRLPSALTIPVIHPACWNFFLSVLVLLEFNQETEVSLFPICLMEALWAPDY